MSPRFLLPNLILPLALLSGRLAAQASPPAPRRSVDDPGIISTNQAVTPAGVQAVFEGRVAGVRFGATPAELWVTVSGNVYRLDWAANRVLHRTALGGRSGVHGVAFDSLAQRAIVTSVGALPQGTTESRLPGSVPLKTTRAVALVQSVSATSTDDVGAAKPWAGQLGDYMAGAVAIAHRARDGRPRIAVATLPANDRIAILDADRDSLVASIAVGVLPIDAVVAGDGAVAWVSAVGGRQPATRDRSATECCDPRAERIRVDARGVALPGHVVRVDIDARRITHTLTVGHHPTGLAWDEKGEHLYVANGVDDAISVIDTRANTLVATIPITPFKARQHGLAPTALALSPDARTLFVALGGINAIALLDVATPTRAHVRGLVPTGWYPSSIDVSADGAHLAVGTLFGVGSGQGTTDGAGGKRSGYVFATRGSVNVIDVPSGSQLTAYTTAVAANNRLVLANDAGTRDESTAPRTAVRARPVPERPGEPTPIQHVVFIIKENRTYDQVFGDLPRGANDSSLVMYGRNVTPNMHALAEQYVVLDHFFASGGNSADGHNWLTQANETEYPMWPLYYGRTYPSEGNDPLAYAAGGFLWETAQQRGRTVQVFGEYAPAASDSIARVRSSLMSTYLTHRDANPDFYRDVLRSRYRTRSEIPSLDKALVREYPGWTQEVPDVVKAQDVIAHLHDWTASGAMPNLVMIVLPSDHTVGTTPGWCTPRACVADNDRALGAIVESLTHTPFWKSMAIMVVEDDAQDGVDHIDGHRTAALAISPFVRRGIVDSTVYNHASMVKTIELMLGLPAMSLFDLTANDMRASFIDADAPPDLTPYTALEAQIALDETNQKLGAITGPDAAARRLAARASSRMRFDVPDAAPSDRLNRILWHDAKGWTRAYPGVKRSLFLPLGVDIDDDDREEVRPVRTGVRDRDR